MFKNIEQFKEAFGGVQRTMNFDTWKPFINEAKEQFFYDVLSYDFVNYLETKINTTLELVAGTTAKEARLIGILRMSLAAYADFLGSFRLMQTTGDAGKTVANPPNMQAPGKWLSVASRNDAITRGDKHLEQALTFLEKNVADFPIWKNSEGFTIKNNCIINSADMFTVYFPNCRGSRRMYLAMLPYLMQAQDELKSLIGIEQAADVILKSKNNAEGLVVSAKNLELVEYCRKVIAPRAVAKAINYVNINQDWRLVSEKDGIVNENVLTQKDRDGISFLESGRYNAAKSGMLKFLYDNASDDTFLPFFEGDIYAAMVANDGPKKRHVNKKEDKYAIL
jgi:hypothetical protein